MGNPVRSPPDSFMEVRTGGAVAWTRPEARPWVEASLESHVSLYRAAAGGSAAGEALTGGRGPAYIVRSRVGAWVVRHGFRGGAVARVLGDRYLRIGIPRPFREVHVSEAARRRGIDTPRVVAAAVYPSGAVYRGDVVTELVPDARSLGVLLFGPARSRDTSFRARLLREAGGMPVRLARAGLHHRDLNVDNLLLPGKSDPPKLVLLDLDRCGMSSKPVPDGGRRMSDRLGRSLRRGEERRGPSLAAEEWSSFQTAVGRSTAAAEVSRFRPGAGPSSPPGDGETGSPPEEPGR